MLVLVTTLTFMLTDIPSRQALFTLQQDELKDMASIAAANINGDTVANLAPGQERNEEFISLRNQLLNQRKNDADIRYSYIMKPVGQDLQFVVDDTYGKDDTAASIGDVYQDSEDPSRQAQDQAEILAGMKGPAVSSTFYTDQWGTFLSGYAPVLDSKGNAVAVFGMDMDASNVLAKEDFVQRQSLLELAILLIASIALVSFFAVSFGRDIRRVNSSLQDLINQKSIVDPASLRQAAQRKDELGQLAKTVDKAEIEVWAALGRKENGPHY